MSFDPNAASWAPSASAAEWTPGGAPAPAPAPDPDIDESDPLWKFCLEKIANGDRDKALSLINNPDTLLEKYPEVEELLMSGAMDTDDADEAGDDIVMATEKMQISEDAPSAPAPAPAASMDEEQEEEPAVFPEDDDADPREHLNLVFIGHVDAGKSTLSGNILYLTENVDKRTIEKYEREAKELNRESWFLAFIMDTNEEERAKGKTVEVGRAQFETDVKRYTIMDAPGHKNYVPNMIMGASQADIAVLVISARKGEFETGFDRGGQTREHALLAKTLGVSHLIVVINKMDDPTVQWQKDRYDECTSKLKPFLKSCGFKIKKEVKFVPISGLKGDNVKDEVDASVCDWWKKSYTSGENNTTAATLMSLLDSLEIEGRERSAPLRIPVLDRYNDRGTIVMGKVESGTIRPGQKITLMPTRQKFKVDAVWANEDPVTSARPGENVLVKLGGGCNIEDVQRGFVICTEPACRAVNKIICQLAIMDMPDVNKIFTAGYRAMYHSHTCEESCTVTKLFETTNRKGIVNKKPAFATVGMRVVCMIELERVTPVETFDDYPFLGRFTLRTEGLTMAIGKIQKLPPKKEGK